MARIDMAHHSMVGCLIESQLSARGVAQAEAKSVAGIVVRYG